MEKETRDKLIALKQSVISDLHNIDVDSYKLGKADERLNVYIKGCINLASRKLRNSSRFTSV